MDVDLAARLHHEVVAPESGDRVSRVLLDGEPELPLDVGLLLVGQPHEHIVVDQLMIAERFARGVEALEDLLRVGIRPQRDRDVL